MTKPIATPGPNAERIEQPAIQAVPPVILADERRAAAKSAPVRPLRPPARQLPGESPEVKPVTTPVPPEKRKIAPKAPARSSRSSTLLGSIKKRISGIMASFMLCVAVPTVLAGLYFGFIASPQYISEFRFSVRTHDAAMGATDMVSAALGTNPQVAFLDSYIVVDYVKSREAVDELERRVGLRNIYSHAEIDWLSRFDGRRSVEALQRYWQSRVTANFDMTTGINIVEVRAFSPLEAQRIAAELQVLCERLVNSLSEKARATHLQDAENQLRRAEEKLQDVRRQQAVFRVEKQTIDTQKEAEAKIGLQSKLRSSLADLSTEYDTISKYMQADSPRLMILKSHIDATQAQLDVLDAEVGTIDGKSNGFATSANVISEYEALQVDQEFATKLYNSALTSYEAARLRSLTNQIYLATYVEPSKADDPSYPRRFLDTFLIFLSCCAAWMIGTLIFYSVRDHAH